MFFLRAAPITSGANLLRRCVRMFVCDEISRFYRRGYGLCTESNLVRYFDRKNVRTTFWVRKVPSINDRLGLQDNGSGSENWIIFLDTFLHFFCFKISVFFMPHVISRKLDSNCTLALNIHSNKKSSKVGRIGPDFFLRRNTCLRLDLSTAKMVISGKVRYG